MCSVTFIHLGDILLIVGRPMSGQDSVSHARMVAPLLPF